MTAPRQVAERVPLRGGPRAPGGLWALPVRTPDADRTQTATCARPVPKPDELLVTDGCD